MFHEPQTLNKNDKTGSRSRSMTMSLDAIILTAITAAFATFGITLFAVDRFTNQTKK